MTIDLEADLRQAFARAADSAPDAAPTWPPHSRHATVGQIGERFERRSRAVRFLVVCASAAAVLAGLLIVVVTRDPQREPAAPTYVPPGTEFLLTATTLRVPVMPYPIEPGSAHSMEVPHHPVLTVSVSAWQVNGHVRQYRCLEAANDGAGCAPEWNWTKADVGQVSTIDNHMGDFDLWTWANVPADAAYVLWNTADGALFQRPVEGVAAFPVYSDHVDRTVAVAVDEAGVELARAGFGISENSAEDPDNGLTSNLGQAATEELDQLARDTVDSCMADPNSAGWDECVARADTIVHGRFVELGGQLVERQHDGCDEGYTESSTGGCYRTPMAPTTTVQPDDTSSSTRMR